MVRSKMEKEKDQVPPLLVLERGTTSNSAARSSNTSSSDSSDDENCNLKRDDLKGEEIKKTPHQCHRHGSWGRELKLSGKYELSKAREPVKAYYTQ